MNKKDFQWDRYQAYLFDMDGVLTQTAKVHAACWKQMFDEFLQQYAQTNDTEFIPFDPVSDYKHYVDGKPRYDGVRSFLAARKIRLPEDSASGPSVKSLGDRKNDFIVQVLETDGVDVYEGAIRFVKQVREAGLKTAVVSSSKNCEAFIRTAEIENLFDARVDGTTLDQLGLAGKPAPDMFLNAAENLSVSPKQAVVVEDAISGVQAGRNGGFGLVIGVNHDGDMQTLIKHGADFVTADLGEFIK